MNAGGGDDQFMVRSGLPSNSRAHGGQGADTIEFFAGDGPPSLTHLGFETVLIQP